MDFINKALGGDNKNEAGNNRPNTEQYQSQPQQGSSSGGGFMDQFTGGGNQNTQTGQTSSGGGFMDKLHGMAGGGRESEKNEDALDKGVDWVQEHVMGQGPQDNENAVEQAKDEQISDFIRGQYKNTTGKDVPIKDKERYGQ